MKKEVEDFLVENNIDFLLHKHKPVYTCEEAEEHCYMVEGVSCKNLFLRQKKKENYFLVVMPASKRADLNKIKDLVGFRNLSFGKPDELMNVLSLESGSVSPFGLLNDKNNIVKMYIDSDLWKADKVSFHPNQNDETIEIESKMFHLIVEKLGNEYEVVDL